jgi:hypothetical protein
LRIEDWVGRPIRSGIVSRNKGETIIGWGGDEGCSMAIPISGKGRGQEKQKVRRKKEKEAVCRTFVHIIVQTFC